MMPDCPSYIDEKSCNRTYNQTRYYWSDANCIWHSTWITFEDLSLDLTSWLPTNMKRLRYLIMFSLFIGAPLFTILALLILLCINCVERFYSVPFAFVSVFSFASFLSGSGALGLFLYEWIHERFYHQSTETEAILLALNPWLIHAERLGLAFWILVAAIATNLFTAMLSCCFCCGLQSDKSKLRIHVKNDKYEIVHMSAYDDWSLHHHWSKTTKKVALRINNSEFRWSSLLLMDPSLQDCRSIFSLSLSFILPLSYTLFFIYLSVVCLISFLSLSLTLRHYRELELFLWLSCASCRCLSVEKIRFVFNRLKKRCMSKLRMNLLSWISSHTHTPLDTCVSLDSW